MRRLQMMMCWDAPTDLQFLSQVPLPICIVNIMLPPILEAYILLLSKLREKSLHKCKIDNLDCWRESTNAPSEHLAKQIWGILVDIHPQLPLVFNLFGGHLSWLCTFRRCHYRN
jgi:hypothetical protein